MPPQRLSSCGSAAPYMALPTEGHLVEQGAKTGPWPSGACTYVWWGTSASLGVQRSSCAGCAWPRRSHPLHPSCVCCTCVCLHLRVLQAGVCSPELVAEWTSKLDSAPLLPERKVIVHPGEVGARAGSMHACMHAERRRRRGMQPPPPMRSAMPCHGAHARSPRHLQWRLAWRCPVAPCFPHLHVSAWLTDLS